MKNIASHYIPILYCDTMMGVKFDPLFYVDISKYFQNKVNAILKHKSQDPKNLVKLATLMNSYRAGQCNASFNTFVEAYSFENLSHFQIFEV